MFEDLFAHQGFEDDGDFLPLISIEEEGESHTDETFPTVLPVLALKNTVLYPGIVIPITVGRDKSIKAINKAYDSDRLIAVLSQKDTQIEDPKPTDLYQVGTVARILKLLRMPDGTATAILQGRKRFQLEEMLQQTPFLEGKIEMIEYLKPKNKLEFEALISVFLLNVLRCMNFLP